MAVDGGDAAGWPTSIWITRPPAASMRAAAAITSMTMKAGTLLRAEGASRLFATSSIVILAKARPAIAAFTGFGDLATGNPDPGFPSGLPTERANVDRDRRPVTVQQNEWRLWNRSWPVQRDLSGRNRQHQRRASHRC